MGTGGRAARRGRRVCTCRVPSQAACPSEPKRAPQRAPASPRSPLAIPPERARRRVAHVEALVVVRVFMFRLEGHVLVLDD